MSLPEAEANARKTIRSVAVIGAGDRGRDFAIRCAASGFLVTLQDVLWSKLRQIEDQVAQEPEPVRDRLRLASSIEDAVRDADVAIDFVPDELESKLEIVSLLDRMAPPKTIFCTPTRLSISDLASCTYRADRCIALSALNNVFDDQTRVVLGKSTSSATAAAVGDWLAAMGHQWDLVPEHADPAGVSGQVTTDP